MAILLTGGTGKTSLRLASLLGDANIEFLLASRHAPSSPPGSSYPHVKFDWSDASTFNAPFEHVFPGGEGIKAVYLIAPRVLDPNECMIDFVKVCRERGVGRFVVLTGSGTQMEEGDGIAGLGELWRVLEGLRREGNGVGYTVLRATWFMENISEWQHKKSITEENKIYSACADAKIPYVSAKDIAAIAFTALTSTTPVPSSRVLGDELLTHDQVAEILSKGLGREVKHVKLTQEESERRYHEDLGMPEHFAKFMAGLEARTAGGAEEVIFEAGTVGKVTGKRAMRFEEWVEENREVLSSKGQ